MRSDPFTLAVGALGRTGFAVVGGWSAVSVVPRAARVLARWSWRSGWDPRTLADLALIWTTSAVWSLFFSAVLAVVPRAASTVARGWSWWSRAWSWNPVSVAFLALFWTASAVWSLLITAVLALIPRAARTGGWSWTWRSWTWWRWAWLASGKIIFNKSSRVSQLTVIPATSACGALFQSGAGFRLVEHGPIGGRNSVLSGPSEPVVGFVEIESAVAGSLAGTPFGDPERQTGVHGGFTLGSQPLGVTGGIEMESIGQIFTLDSVSRSNIDILGPVWSSHNDNIIGTGASDQWHNLVMVSLHGAPVWTWLVENFENDVRNVFVLIGHFLPERLGMIDIWIFWASVPIDKDVDTVINASLDDGFH